jgi:hypothetical protein
VDTPKVSIYFITIIHNLATVTSRKGGEVIQGTTPHVRTILCLTHIQGSSETVITIIVEGSIYSINLRLFINTLQ